jgi:thymidylate synthase (FAD)
MTVEITTSRAIAAQLLRHRSFTFQEFSQRYAVSTELEPIELRTQDIKNRQGSGSVLFDDSLTMLADRTLADVFDAYDYLILKGVSKETARMILPLCTRTILYMTGNVRSWIHYFEQRCAEHTQKEHRDVAHAVRDIFNKNFPTVAQALEETK